MNFEPQLPWRIHVTDQTFTVDDPRTEIRDSANGIVCHDEHYYPSAPHPDEMAFIVQAVNYHDRMVQAIARLLAAEAAILKTGGVASYAAGCAERIEALEALEQIHKELNP